MKIQDEKWYRLSPDESWFKSKESQEDKPLKYNVVKPIEFAEGSVVGSIADKVWEVYKNGKSI